MYPLVDKLEGKYSQFSLEELVSLLEVPINISASLQETQTIFFCH
jgi:hypothetical protein